MAVSVEQMFPERLDNDRAESQWLVRGASTAYAARSAVESTAPTTLINTDLKRTNVEVRLLEGVDSTNAWLARVQYTRPGAKSQDPPVPGEAARWSFETTGGQQHIEVGESHVNSYAPAGETAPDHDGAINVTEDGVEGVDVGAPTFRFSLTKAFNDGSEPSASTLADLTFTTNQATFQGFAAGEVLFLGATGSQRDDGSWEITFTFERRKNRTGLTIGSITGIAKKGWEYLWVEFRQDTDATAGRRVRLPIAVHVEQVYESGDFSQLGV